MTFAERLHGGNLPLIADGAIGTRLLDDRATPATAPGQLPCVEHLNLTAPDLVLSVHRSYLQAGAELQVTNSFGASAHRLKSFGLDAKVRSINEKAAALARAARDEISGRTAFILGSCGPIGAVEDATDLYTEQMTALAAGGIDVFLIESVRSLSELKSALTAASVLNRRFPAPLPVMVSICPVDESLGFSDGSLTDLFSVIADYSVSVLGVNCGDGVQLVEQALAVLRDRFNGPLLAMPSAGLPSMHEGRLKYPLSAELWADKIADWHQKFSLAVAGGCCGTRPQHIKAIRRRFFPALQES